MREMLILTAIAGMAMAANNYTQCPDIEPWSLPHEDDCTKYYKCLMGRKFMFDCDMDVTGKYLCFDPDSQTCSFWDGCKCRSQKCISSSDSHKWPDPNNEKWYFQCKNGQANHIECEQGTVFNPELLECVPKSSDCTKPGSRYPHPCYCKFYYECKDGQLTKQTCSDGWAFDYILSTCRPGEEARCKNPNNGCPNVGKAQLPDPESCYRYYQCMDGVKTLRPCPEYMMFDEVKGACVWWSDTTCNKADATTPKVPTNSCLRWPKPKKSNMDDCNRYYECVNGKIKNGKCLQNHYFNEQIQACDLYKSGNCKDSSTKDPNCPIVDCGKKRFPHKNCEWYYECLNGVKQPKMCPNGLYYNELTEMCDLSENSKCNNVCTPGTRHPHDCQCNQYYECINKESVLKTCDNGQNFDTVTLKCLPKEKAICHKHDNNAVSAWLD